MEKTFEQLWEEYANRLESFVTRQMGDPELARDILQEIFMKVHLQIGSLRDPGKLNAWIFQLTRNVIADHYRRADRAIQLPDADPCGPGFEENYNVVFHDAVRSFAAALPEKYREALLLTEFEGMTQVELARHLGISLSGAKSRVQRAREKLRERLNDCCHVQPDPFGNILHYTVRPGCCKPGKK